MFRISRYMHALCDLEKQADDGTVPTTATTGRVRNTTRGKRRSAPRGPVVIWNLVRRCNLTCKHCYSVSANIDFPGELDFDAVCTVMDDLEAFGVPVLILSGGEPLMRPDIFRISRRAKARGFYVGLSTNGTLIDESTAQKIRDIGYDYVGISIDGIRNTHDRFRQQQGAFELALNGLRHCQNAGVKTGMRFTPTLDNVHELPELLDLMQAEGVDKFYLSHLNYGGRGNRNRGSDVAHRQSREVMDVLFEAAFNDARNGGNKEFVTGNNDADGVYLLRWAARRLPSAVTPLRSMLEAWGGNASGMNVANIDNLGNVHPDTFWWNYTLGNVLERPFSEIWLDTSDPLMAGLKQRIRPLRGRCRVCPEQPVCRGNTRVRAFQTTGDPWWEDPACYLSDEELGIEPMDYADDRPQPVNWPIRVIRHAG